MVVIWSSAPSAHMKVGLGAGDLPWGCAGVERISVKGRQLRAHTSEVSILQLVTLMTVIQAGETVWPPA
jgi:hypothetical protein